MPVLNLPVTGSDIGIIDSEGVVFNWQKRMLVFCGGKQVLNTNVSTVYSVSQPFLVHGTLFD